MRGERGVVGLRVRKGKWDGGGVREGGVRGGGGVGGGRRGERGRMRQCSPFCDIAGATCHTLFLSVVTCIEESDN